MENPVKGVAIAQTAYPQHSKADDAPNKGAGLPCSICYTGDSEEVKEDPRLARGSFVFPQRPLRSASTFVPTGNPFIFNILPVTQMDAIF